MATFTDFALHTEELDSPALINALFKANVVETPTDLVGADGFATLKCGSQSALVFIQDSKIHLIKDVPEFRGIKSRDAAQSCFMWSIKNKQLTVCLGSAGSGKTFLASAYAAQSILREDKKVVLLKPTKFVGGDSNAIAAVPGGISEKLEPYTASFEQHMEAILGVDHRLFLSEWEEKRKLEFAAVELCRGRHFANSTVILDEAQNLTFHELTSVISRVDDTSKLIILGDPLQIDLEGVSWEDTGLFRVLDSTAWWHAPFASCIELHTSYRGRLANLANDIILESR